MSYVALKVSRVPGLIGARCADLRRLPLRSGGRFIVVRRP